MTATENSDIEEAVGLDSVEWLIGDDRSTTAFIRMPERPAHPMALLIHLTLTARQGLETPPFSIPCREFLAAGHAVASFDLPNHGENVDEFGEGLTGMAAAFAAGRRPFDRAVAAGTALIDAWFERHPESGAIVVSGVSRGALVALHLYAAESRITAAAAFAPVTDLLALREFDGLADSRLVHAASAIEIAPVLTNRPLFVSINQDDQRVDTAACVAFVDALALDSGSVEMVRVRIDPGQGHSVTDEAYREGSRWLLDYATT